MKKSKSILLPLGVLLLLLCVAILFSNYLQPYRVVAAYCAFGASLLVFFISLLVERRHKL